MASPREPSRYTYTYKKRRSEFGRQCIFGDVTSIICEINQDAELKKRFQPTICATVNVQNIQQMAEDEITTDNAQMLNVGISHYEGGWPNDVNLMNEEDKKMYRTLSRKTDEYDAQLKRMLTRMERKIAQNNAINIFQEYFVGVKSALVGQSYDPEIESISYFQSPLKAAWASHSSIAPYSQDKIVVSYTNIAPGQRSTIQTGLSSYIWDLTQNLHPILELKCRSSLATVEYNEKNEFVIAAGQSDGIVALFDSRTGGIPTMQSIHEHSHRESVSALKWTMSKDNTEFFTCSSDAFVMWWDIRKMTKPHECYQLDLDTAGCSTLDYTFSMPTRFLIGTTNGLIVNGNRRGTTYADRFTYTMKSFSGSVNTIERNPFADKYSLCIGDQSIRFWSDENRETPIMQSIEYSHDLTCGAWNRNRCSNFFVGHIDGTIDMWDLLYDQYKPIASISIVESKIEHIQSHPNGKLLLSLHRNGDVHLMQISEFLASHKIAEKSKLIEIFDRELSQELLFLTKIREQRTQANQSKDDSFTKNDEVDKPDLKSALNECIANFEEILQKELK